MEDTTKSLISLRIPTTLLAKVDKEAKASRRSRAFIITETLEGKYGSIAVNGKRKTAKKAAD